MREEERNGMGPALTLTSWRPRGITSFAESIEQGRKLGATGPSGWWIGDWLRYGNETYGERYVRAASSTGYEAALGVAA